MDYTAKIRRFRAMAVAVWVGILLGCAPPAAGQTREFEICGDRPLLGGRQIDIWGLRCGSAMTSDTITERLIGQFDNFLAHGINAFLLNVQGGNGGWPNGGAALNGLEPDGTLKPKVKRRMKRLILEANRRGIVVCVEIFSHRHDEELEGDAAVEKAVKQVAAFLVEEKLRNVFVDICHEYNISRMEQPLLKEPGGPEKKRRLQKWFQSVAPDIECGVCPYFNSDTAIEYPGADILIVQKEHRIPPNGLVINIETQRQDQYNNEGIFSAEGRRKVFQYCRDYQAAGNAFLIFHSAWVHGITGASGTSPHYDPGGTGTGPDDRGIRFYFDWVRANIGRYEYPRHVKQTRHNHFSSNSKGAIR